MDVDCRNQTFNKSFIIITIQLILKWPSPPPKQNDSALANKYWPSVCEEFCGGEGRNAKYLLLLQMQYPYIVDI